jgi:hypothetical protein
VVTGVRRGDTLKDKRKWTDPAREVKEQGQHSLVTQEEEDTEGRDGTYHLIAPLTLVHTPEGTLARFDELPVEAQIALLLKENAVLYEMLQRAEDIIDEYSPLWAANRYGKMVRDDQD